MRSYSFIYIVVNKLNCDKIMRIIFTNKILKFRKVFVFYTFRDYFN